jgi:hypothetical protein
MTTKPNTRIIHTSFTNTNNETSKWALDDTEKVLVVPKSGTMSNVPVFQEIEQLRNNKHTFIMEQNFNLALNLKQYIFVFYFFKELVVLLKSNPTKALIAIDPHMNII